MTALTALKAVDEDLCTAYLTNRHAVVQTVKVESWPGAQAGHRVDEKLEVFAVNQRWRRFQLNMVMHCSRNIVLEQLLREVTICLNPILSAVVLHLYRFLSFELRSLMIQDLKT